MGEKNKRKRFNQDHCIGNYPAEKRALLERAIEETNAPVCIKDVATDRPGRAMPGYISAWVKRGKNGFYDLSSFWKVYHRLAAESERGEG